MKTKLSILTLFAAVMCACSPDGLEKADFSNYTVDKVVCQASSNYLVADGVSELDLHVKLYSKMGVYTDIYGVQRDLYMEIPKERQRNHDVKIFVNGTQITTPYTTTSASPSTLQCYAEVDGIRSSQSPAKSAALYPRIEEGKAPGGTAPEYPADPDPFYFEVTVREAYTPELRRIPVIFHVIDTKNNYDRGQSVQSSAIYDLVDVMNDVYGRKFSTAPNGANPNIEFVPAIKDPSGNKLAEPGINRILLVDNDVADYDANSTLWIWNLDKTDKGLPMKDEYEELAAAGNLPVRTPRAFWNPDRYLNIWLIFDFSDVGYSSSASTFMPLLFPEGVYDTGQFPLPEGWENALRIMSPEKIEMWKKNPADLRLTDEPLGNKQTGLGQAGIYAPSDDITNYNASIMRQIGAFFGLIPNSILSKSSSWPMPPTVVSDKSAWLDDFCDDTPVYNAWYTDYKYGGMEITDLGSSRVKYTMNAPYFIYNSHNVMEDGTSMSYLTQDQVRRMQWVLENAPGRQMWKDSWAITE